MYMYRFTVFTPTHNRAHTIGRVFESLNAQTFRDFEWIVVDDGSTDNTRELVEAWEKISDFQIRYVYQPHRHKKSAFNRGVRLAKGELFLCADSDDAFVETALERLAKHWIEIPKELRNKFVGVSCLCKYNNGDHVGDRFPGGWGCDSDYLEIRYKHKVRGDKWGFHRTEILRSFPFPEKINGHVPESVVWGPIAKKYQTRFINEALLIVHLDSGNRITNITDVKSIALGALYSKRSVLTFELSYFWNSPKIFLLEAARWMRFRLHLNKDQLRIAKFWPDGIGGLLIILMTPFGILWWLYDQLREQRRH